MFPSVPWSACACRRCPAHVGIYPSRFTGHLACFRFCTQMSRGTAHRVSSIRRGLPLCPGARAHAATIRLLVRIHPRRCRGLQRLHWGLGRSLPCGRRAADDRWRRWRLQRCQCGIHGVRLIMLLGLGSAPTYSSFDCPVANIARQPGRSSLR